MIFKLAGIVTDSIVDGPGVRLTVFFQGCPHGCPGCHNPQTHDFNGGMNADTDEILEILRQSKLMTGLTISGGEPFAQRTALMELARGAKALGKDVWVYTGYTWDTLPFFASLNYIDVLVDGPYIERERSLSLLFRGSRNQRLIDVQKSLMSGNVVLWEEEPWLKL